MQAPHEVADVLQKRNSELFHLCQNSWQLRTLQAIRKCRTAAMGGHIDHCNNPNCGKLHLSYNSCRNRHCPKCQGHKREEWIRAREADLLDVPYYHLVFTLPAELNQLALYQPKLLYDLLFATAWSTVQTFAADHKYLGAQSGMIAILHTWGQNLSLHPHLHCILPAGGVTPSQKWKQAKGKGKFLFPVKAMSKVFRARMVEQLRKKSDLDQSVFDKLFKYDWVIYAKRPFASPKYVVEYLGRYTHKIAISNHRIISIDEQTVTFKYKDYRQAGKSKTMTLTHAEFIRRFSQHILPKGFTRIRHFGILSSTLKKKILPMLQATIGSLKAADQKPIMHRICPICKKGTLTTLVSFSGRAPPKQFIEKLIKNNVSMN